MDQNQNETSAIDERVARVLNRRAGASASEQYPVTIERADRRDREVFNGSRA